jgi:hypothetical protein
MIPWTLWTRSLVRRSAARARRSLAAHLARRLSSRKIRSDARSTEIPELVRASLGRLPLCEELERVERDAKGLVQAQDVAVNDVLRLTR